jgi:short-subunit dehydrogenase
MQFNGKWILVTGGSSGIGAAFARELAKRGANLILVALDQEGLIKISDQITSRHPVKVETIAMDLARLEAAGELAVKVADLGVMISGLVNNAGIGGYGEISGSNTEMSQRQILLNVYTSTSLVHLFIDDMKKRHDGFIINMSSTGGFAPAPYLATYAATKTYILSLSQALWGENQTSGVKILAVCPGGTDTGFFDAAQSEDLRRSAGKLGTAEGVVLASLIALEKGDPVVTAGLKNKIMEQALRFAPRKVAISLAAKTLAPREK